jgi:hypothetical protein
MLIFKLSYLTAFFLVSMIVELDKVMDAIVWRVARKATGREMEHDTSLDFLRAADCPKLYNT